MRYQLATPADDPEIRALLRGSPIDGEIQVTLEREPDSALAGAIEGDLHQVVIRREEPSEEMIHEAVKDGVMSLGMVPVYMGSAFKNKGVQTLLDAVLRYLPSPATAVPQTATDLDEKKEVTLAADIEKPLVCMAFKITTNILLSRTHRP